MAGLSGDGGNRTHGVVPPKKSAAAYVRDVEFHLQRAEHSARFYRREFHKPAQIMELLPPCVQAMRCYCAAHAKGRDAIGPCDANEDVEP